MTTPPPAPLQHTQGHAASSGENPSFLTPTIALLGPGWALCGEVWPSSSRQGQCLIQRVCSEGAASGLGLPCLRCFFPSPTPEAPSNCHQGAVVLGLGVHTGLVDLAQPPLPPHKGQILKRSAFIMPTENKNFPECKQEKCAG